MQDENRHLGEPDSTPPEGSAKTFKASVEPHQVSDAPFPPFEITGGALTDRNEDRVPSVPIGPLRGSFAPTSQETVPFKPRAKDDEATDEDTCNPTRRRQKRRQKTNLWAIIERLFRI